MGAQEVVRGAAAPAGQRQGQRRGQAAAAAPQAPLIRCCCCWRGVWVFVCARGRSAAGRQSGGGGVGGRWEQGPFDGACAARASLALSPPFPLAPTCPTGSSLFAL